MTSTAPVTRRRGTSAGAGSGVSRAIVLGIGSPFGDDTLGWLLVERLSEKAIEIPGWGIEWDRLDRPGPGLLQRVEGYDAAILVDAMRAGLPAGSVRKVSPAELEVFWTQASSHAIGVAETLALGEKLGLLPPLLCLLGIEMGDGLPTASVEQAEALIDLLLSG